MVSVEMPARSKSFSLKRTVMKLAGRAPIRPTRAPFSPATTWQVATKSRRSCRNCGLFGILGVVGGQAVLEAVLLQVVAGRHLAAERVAAVLDASSCRLRRGRRGRGSARRARTSASTLAMARSSPKFGSVTSTPMISSRCCLNRSAQLLRVGDAFDAAVGRVIRAERDGLDAFAFEQLEDRLAALLAQVAGEKAPIADNDAKNRLLHVVLLMMVPNHRDEGTEVRDAGAPLVIAPCAAEIVTGCAESPSSRARSAGTSRTAARKPRARPCGARRCGRARPSGRRPRRRTTRRPRRRRRSIAAPSTPASVTFGRTTGMPKMSAVSCSHASDLLPPPDRATAVHADARARQRVEHLALVERDALEQALQDVAALSRRA